MRTTLVVDDEPMIRRKVAETLADYGFESIVEVVLRCRVYKKAADRCSQASKFIVRR